MSVQPSFQLKLAYLHTHDPQYVRVAKNLRLFASLFAEVHYVGCSRGVPWQGAADDANVHLHMDQRVLGSGPQTALELPGFVRFCRRVLMEVRPDIVVATNEDMVLPFAAGLLPRPRYLVCDLLDSIAIRTTGYATRLAPVWHALSEWTLRAVDGLVEVTDERLARHRRLPPHSTVIFNSPIFKEVPARRGLPSPFVYVSGSAISGISGLETLLAAIDRVPGLNIVFAGRVHDQWIRDVFIASPRVEYLGVLSPEQSLEVAKASAAIFAYYRPVNANYLFAAPNKLFDAMMLGVPLIINSECRASRFADRHGFGVVAQYADVGALASGLERLRQGDSQLASACTAAREAFRRDYDWSLMRDRYQRFFAELTAPRSLGRP